jgi:hypothetical protein
MAEKRKAETAEAAEGSRSEVRWLDELEAKVHAAAQALRELRAENQRLAEHGEQLEQRVAELEASDAEAGSGWEQERREIRGRVEKITEGLEDLLRE